MSAVSNEAAQQQQYLTFLLAGQEYAIGILKVKEIIEYDTVTPVPRTPPWIRGVINLRGTVVPVVDLAVKFGLAESQAGRTTCIIIVEALLGAQVTTMGVIADAVSQVLDVLSEQIRPVPQFGAGIKVDYLLGVTQLGKKFALLLDMDKVLSSDELLGLHDLSSLTQDACASEAVGGLPSASETVQSDGGLPQEEAPRQRQP